MFDTLFSPDQFLTVTTTTQKIDQILSDQKTLNYMRYTIGQLEGSTGGTSQMMYTRLGYHACSHYAVNVLCGLNQKIIDSRKRARKMNFDYDITLSDLLELWIQQQGRCAVTGVVMSFESGDLQNKNAYACSVDRRDNEQGYTVDNVRLLTHWANNAKSTWPDYMFEVMITEIVNNRKTSVV